MNPSPRLSREDFAALAAGAGSTETIEALRAGQVNKHTVMILAILDLAGDTVPGAAAVLDDAYALLVAAQSAAPAAVAAVLGHPHVGTWAGRFLRRLRGTGDDPVPAVVDAGQFAAIAAVAAIRAGLSFTVSVPPRDGAVFLPTLGLATIGGAGPAAAATIRRDGQLTTITAAGPDGATVAVPPDPAQDAPGWLGLRRLRAEAGGRTVVTELDDLDPCRDQTDHPLATRLAEADVVAWQRTLDQAWQVLVDHHPEQAAAIATGMVALVPLAPRDRINGNSLTTRNAFGRAALTPPRDGLALADTLIHEFHHSKLNAVMDLVPLHTAGRERRYYAPWRDDPRPLEGLLHGTYAFVGVTDFWRVQRQALTGAQRMLAEFEFALWRRQVRRAAAVLLESGKLTVAGAEFVRHLREKATAWQDVPVPDHLRRLVDRCIDEHEVRWRLRNLHADPDAVQALASAWQGGEPCPLAAAQVRVIVTPRHRQPGNRIGLIRTRLAQPDRFAEVCRQPERLAADHLTEADLAFASDDLTSAYRGFLAQIADDPAHLEAWAGLVPAGRVAAPGPAIEWLGRRPELGLAVYRRVASAAQRAPELAALMQWLSTGEGDDGVGDVGTRRRAGQAVR